MSTALIAALSKLVLQPEGLPLSVLTAAQRRALDDWRHRTSGCVVTIPSGRGVIYIARDLAVLEMHLRSLRPQTEDSLPENIPRRAANIALTRNSKGRGHAHDAHYLLLKAVGDGVVWRNHQGNRFDLSQSTQTAGVGALAIHANDGWYSDRPLWLVENQAPFDRLDWMPEGVTATVAYYAGQLDGRVLAWLGTHARAPEVVLFSDYDGVGLLNYLKLKKTSLAPARFWIMPGWRHLLREYGNASVWEQTHAVFESALRDPDLNDPDPEFFELIAEMRHLGLALEHEAVWLS